MPFKRYVEIGRVCLINYGEECGQLVAISDIVDQNRVSSCFVFASSLEATARREMLQCTAQSFFAFVFRLWSMPQDRLAVSSTSSVCP